VVVKKKNMLKKKLHYLLYVVLLYFVHHAKIHVSDPWVFKRGPVRTRERRQLSCWAICQNIISTAELFSELSAELFS